MSMSKKDFIALADVIRDHNEIWKDKFSQLQISNLADFCEQQNPLFNRDRWIGYINGECGASDGKIKTKD